MSRFPDASKQIVEISSQMSLALGPLAVAFGLGAFTALWVAIRRVPSRTEVVVGAVVLGLVVVFAVLTTIALSHLYRSSYATPGIVLALLLLIAVSIALAIAIALYLGRRSREISDPT